LTIALKKTGLGQMTAAVIRSFEADKGLVRVVVAGALSETPLRVRGSDCRTVARLRRGQHIRFSLVIDCTGQGCAVDISAI
jgi:hypothetical protein